MVGSKIYIFGGNAGTNMRLNDMHILDTGAPSSHCCTALCTPLSLRSRLPHLAILVCRGIDEMHWITPLVGGAAPWERSGHTASVIGGRVFIFGGFSYAGGEWLNDTHIFNTGTVYHHRPPCLGCTASTQSLSRALTGSLKWRRATTTGAPPSGRNYHTASVVGKRIFIFGGFGNNVWLNDMHIFDSEVLGSCVLSFVRVQAAARF